MDCSINYLITQSKCMNCIPVGMIDAIKTMVIAQWANCGSVIPPFTGPVIIDDGTATFWRLIVNDDGLIGATSDPGPATPDVILPDGSGGFWKLIVSVGGLVGALSDAGPATTTPVLADSLGDHWSIIVDPSGNVGANM